MVRKFKNLGVKAKLKLFSKQSIYIILMERNSMKQLETKFSILNAFSVFHIFF
jgi:hypothetical protein